MIEAALDTPQVMVANRVNADLAAALAGAWRVYEPLRLHLVFVRDWFGPNWLRFAGKFQGAAGMHTKPGYPVAVPPFHPNRVRSAAWFARSETDAPWLPISDPPLNIDIGSEEGSRRRFASVAGDRSMAAWIGDDGEGRQSMLLYATLSFGEATWYAGTEGVGRAGSRFVGITGHEFKMLQRRAG